MTGSRIHPFDRVFDGIATDRFPAISEAVDSSAGIDEWLMAKPVIELLGELRPDDGLGSAVDEFVLFVHAAWSWWQAGSRTVLQGDVVYPIRTAMYIQVAPRTIWARLGDDETHEPLDGWFVLPDGDCLRVVACLGIHPNRPGLSVLTAEGRRPIGWLRTDGSQTFAPQMAGGDVAGLSSIAAPEELLLLAWGANPGEETTDGNDGSQGGRVRD